MSPPTNGARGREHVLYVSYDGLAEPLGQSQVHSYLGRLARWYAVTLLSYEKPADLRNLTKMQKVREQLSSEGIRWIRLRYHKRPTLLATSWDVVVGIVVGVVACRAQGVRVIHARGYVPSVIAVWLKRLCRTKFLFDMRGFWPDEKLEAGHWTRHSVPYRLAKRWERRFFERADAIVSLTTAGVQEFPLLGYRIPQGTPIEVIPTCVDTARFCPGPKDPALLRRFGLEGGIVIGCTGTLSGWYLRGSMLRYLALFVQRMPSAKALVVTREDPDRLRAEALTAGIPEERFVITRVEFDDMPAYLRLMDVGLFFIRVCFSKRGSAATKLAEFLATGVPVIINDGIGDSGRIVQELGVGVVLGDTTPAVFEASLSRVNALLEDPERRQRCRQVACRYFDLTTGVGTYRTLYERLTNRERL